MSSRAHTTHGWGASFVSGACFNAQTATCVTFQPKAAQPTPLVLSPLHAPWPGEPVAPVARPRRRRQRAESPVAPGERGIALGGLGK